MKREKNKILVGVIGFGVVGKRRYKLLMENPVYEVVAICEPDNLTNAQDIRVPVYKNYEELVDSPVDAVVVCTPNNVSARIVISALRMGLHTFCEKPPGRSLAEVQEVVAEERKSPSSKLMYGFNHRYHEAVKEAKAIIESGRLGRVLSLKGVYGKSGGNNFDNAWRTKREIAGGGILLDQGIHMLDLFRYFCGDFTEYHSFVENLFWDHNVEDNVFAIMRNEQNQVAMIHSSATLWRHTFSMDITLAEGYLKLHGILSGTMSYGRESLIIGYRQFEDVTKAIGNPREEIIYFDRDNSWKEELDEFARCILEDRAVRMGNSTDALKAMEMVESIYKADKRWFSQWSPA